MALQRGLELVGRAVEYDTAQNFAEAASFYDASCKEFQQALLETQDPQMKATIGLKLSEYQSRSQQIQLQFVKGSPANTAYSAPTAISTPAASVQPSLRACCEGPSTTETRQQLGLEHPGSMGGFTAWSTAMELVERGKQEDFSKNFVSALPYYECAMDYFLRTLKDDELTADMKTKASDQMKTFLKRAEDLKEPVQQLRLSQASMRPPQNVSPQLQQPQLLSQQAPAVHSVATASPIPSRAQSADNAAGVASSKGCAGCGKSMVESIFALDKEWHPQCFLTTVKCGVCDQPFDMRLDLRIKDGIVCHPKCVDDITGLARMEEKKFPLGHGSMWVKAVLPKRQFRRDETISFDVMIDNTTKKRITSLEMYLKKTEERKSLSTTAEPTSNHSWLGNATSHCNHRLPMSSGNFVEKVNYNFPPNLAPTHVNDVSLYRAYEFRIRIHHDAVVRKYIRFSWPITIL